MTFTSKRFEVRANPWSGVGDPVVGNVQLSNLTDKLLPTDEDRLKWMYTQYGPSSTFNPKTGEFYPAGGVNYGQHEIDGAPGDRVGDFIVPIPRISPIDEGQFGAGGNGCPSGFYQFGKVCVPDASLNPDSVGSQLGGGGLPGSAFYGKGGPRGIINAITPPQFTQPNQEFILITDMQNIGGQPAKFYTMVSIPEINLNASTSNSTLVNPLAKMKIGHRIIMPATAKVNTLLNASVQLGQLPLTPVGSSIPSTQIIDDTGKVSIPAPGYRGPLPPTGGGVAGSLGSGVGLFPTPQGGFPQPPIPPYPGVGGFGPTGGMPFPAAGGYPFPPSQIQIVPFKTVYSSGDSVTVSAGGFIPGETVSVQTYTTTNLQGYIQYQTRMSNYNALASNTGNAYATIRLISNTGSNKLAVVMLGNRSGRKTQVLVNVVGNNQGGSFINIGLGGINIGI